MSAPVLIGYFEKEEQVLEATRAVREAGHDLRDVYTPYAVHGLDDAMGLKPSRLTWVCFVGGLTGCTLAMSLQLYTSVVSWPLNVGGKPFNSFPAFIPVTFELTVLFAALTTVAAFLVRTKLFPGNKQPALPRVTDDRFAIVVAPRQTPESLEAAEDLMRRHGAVATDVREVPS
ncbi:quinol:cytochrome c oxidoreductase membrane protein [Myxococcus fulvus]|uniref:Quinol:cytochrome c oxidoreductase membrane protein n=1 Tax=Myxococcus fulvus TaxID=33 RepID=A0A511TBY8_MYXFU|nr:DUF3341 domain-containing protein [Myxococcus fulvus]GEN11113.1 hypothetical protein MFU01_61500 [Myxococcus fulvus]SET42526.1 quinol:cytochrome c oxidoreductase membrane protein [Myxococcus fulvus]